jgi:hypothetical protein
VTGILEDASGPIGRHWASLTSQERRQVSKEIATAECLDQGIDLIGNDHQHRRVAGMLKVTGRSRPSGRSGTEAVVTQS